jgi:hypothetical protein
MRSQSLLKYSAVTVAMLGIALHGYISLFKAEGGPDAFTLGLLALSAVPYGVCLLVTLRGKGQPVLGLFGAAAALVFSSIAYHSVFVAPSASTAALGLLVLPVVNLLIAVPVAMAVGYGLQRWLARAA